MSQESLALPSTSLADNASALIDRVLTPALRNHSVRGFLFGRAIADRHGLRPGADYDEEVMYLICALHDLGLAENASGERRFEIDGADAAARFIEDNGVTDARVDTIWDAIAAHTTGFTDSPIYRRRRPPETWLAVEGIGIDVMGGPVDLPPGYADQVHAIYPRLGGSRALIDAIEAQGLANPLQAPPASLAREIIRQRHPGLPEPSWDDVLVTSGWRD
ncbi:HD domain-containing protein [Nocardia sp. NPDC046473]|uniref:HD domain-containing protein n=1 Tax=Nocardia sp. NPDC046473 TaxID=3155733 RepID=UPI0033E90A64